MNGGLVPSKTKSLARPEIEQITKSMSGTNGEDPTPDLTGITRHRRGNPSAVPKRKKGTPRRRRVSSRRFDPEARLRESNKDFAK